METDKDRDHDCKVLRTENPGSLCVRDRRDKAAITPFATCHKMNRVGSRIEINLFINEVSKPVAMIRSVALLKDMLQYKTIHVIFCAFGGTNG